MHNAWAVGVHRSPLVSIIHTNVFTHHEEEKENSMVLADGDIGSLECHLLDADKADVAGNDNRAMGCKGFGATLMQHCDEKHTLVRMHYDEVV